MAFGHELDALDDCDLVIEAVAEDEAMKIDVFGRLDALCKPDAVLASNTSSIPIMKLARATKREAEVIGIHFFNPGAGAAARGAGDVVADVAGDREPTSSSSRPTRWARP